MPLVSITRLRIRAWRFLPLFFLRTSAIIRQTRQTEGFLAGSLLADRQRAFWTMTLWTDEADMRRFLVSSHHGKAMTKLQHWCDEASVVHWQQSESALPAWPEADARMRTEGRPSKLRNPGPQHQTLTFASPATTTGLAIKPKG